MTEDWADSSELYPIREQLEQAVHQHRLPPQFLADCPRIILPIAREIARSHEARSQEAGALIWGVCGSQGSGKSTMVHFLSIMLESLCKLRCLTLSIDDFYLSKAARGSLADKVHPLLKTRGVPGTHDVERGIELFRGLKQSRPGQLEHAPLSLPVFDKARDDVAEGDRPGPYSHGVDIVLFEGWCVGTPPQPASALVEPVNKLEAQEDPDGQWRNFVNAELEGAYAEWFSLLDHLLLIKAPGFDKVHQWRLEQEDKLRASFTDRGEAPPSGLMDAAQIQRFISHYERLTRWNLEVLPEKADMVLELNEDHSMRRLVTSKYSA
ncbi:MAG: hypothetical protein CME36_03345 [unclassified Hahellaceae]|nr:hypothetical protein [Hahellaceae bacterium]|tara:strand:- start:27813 stop:28781 length:969 start_codon:yes stop_codon:yes gene_type:complete